MSARSEPTQWLKEVLVLWTKRDFATKRFGDGGGFNQITEISWTNPIGDEFRRLNGPVQVEGWSRVKGRPPQGLLDG